MVKSLKTDHDVSSVSPSSAMKEGLTLETQFYVSLLQPVLFLLFPRKEANKRRTSHGKLETP